MPVVSIIIVNYNTKVLILQCIESIIKYTVGLTYEIIVVDNASSDGSQQAIRTQYPMVRLIDSALNLGFGKANNLGAGCAEGEFLFFLNSDTYFQNNALKIFHDFFTANNKLCIGCLGTVLTDHDCIENGTGSEFPTLLGYLKTRMKPLLDKIGRKTRENKVEYILGADMFVPKSVFEAAGKFDERFFMYYEESDLQLQMAKLGYERLIISGPKIVHLEGKSSSHNINKIILVQTSAFKYYKKNRPAPEYIALRAIGILDGLRMFFSRQYGVNDAITYLKFNFKKLDK